VNEAEGAAARTGVAASPAPYLRVRGVGKTYRSERGDVAALESIDLDVAKAEFVSILGPSGCGKSTLLKCVAGLEDVTEGAVEIEGRPVVEPPEEIGMIFQRDVLLDWRTVIDNVLLPVEFRRLDAGEWRQRALDLLATFELADFAKRFPWELSGGMRQRVAICRGLILDPDLLLMDEPFGALDAITRDELNLELERIWERTRKTILFVTHSIPEAVFLSDRVVVMSRNPGRVVEVMHVELPRPRSLELRETPEFGRYAGHIRTIFEGLGVMKRNTQP
jgi:NitT/TauT family transport system ATP-binding protein